MLQSIVFVALFFVGCGNRYQILVLTILDYIWRHKIGTDENVILVWVRLCVIWRISFHRNCFLEKTNPCHTRPTTVANQLSHVMTAIFVYVPSAGNFPWNCSWKAVWMIENISDKRVNSKMYTLVKGSRGLL